MAKKISKQSRCLRKKWYIRVKNVLAKMPHEPGQPEYYVVPPPDLTVADGERRDATFLFLHTSKRIAIRGFVGSLDALWKTGLMMRVERELRASHPVPARVVTILHDTVQRTEYGYSYDVDVDEEWAEAFQAREDAGKARLLALESEPRGLMPGMTIAGDSLFALAVCGVVDKPAISNDDIADAIMRYRALGEPFVVAAYNQAGEVVPSLVTHRK